MNEDMTRFKGTDDYIIDEDEYNMLEKQAEDRSIKSSEREKVATEVEREAEKMKMAEYMESKVGEEYDAIVSSITSFGMFAELENTIEGLIRFDSLGDEYFIYDEDRKILMGEVTKKTYKIGDKIRIRVLRASKELREIDFELSK